MTEPEEPQTEQQCTNMNCHGDAEFAYWMPDLGQFSRVQSPDHDMLDDGDLAPYVCEACRDNMAGGPHWDAERFVRPQEKLIADGGEPLGPESGQSGLYEKYEVYKDGEPVEDCFVLEPGSDPDAREALMHYMRVTEDEELAQDLHDWLSEIRTGGAIDD
jgi:hypothetical protein